MQQSERENARTFKTTDNSRLKLKQTSYTCKETCTEISTKTYYNKSCAEFKSGLEN